MSKSFFGGDWVNKVLGYRKMLGYTQKDLAEKFNISVTAYRLKEIGKISFKKKEMLVFRDMLRKSHFPDITIDEIFF